MTVETVLEPTLSVSAPGNGQLGACQVDSYFSDRCVFVHTFTPVAATKWRIYVRDCTRGGSPDATTQAAGGQPGVHKVCLRAIEGYNRSGLPAVKYGGRLA